MAEQTVELAPGESKAVTFEAIPHEAKTFQVTVDGLSGAFEATWPPPAGAIIDLTWDSPPPFTAGEKHTLTIRISWEGLYFYWANIYVNDMFAGAPGRRADNKEIIVWDWTFAPGSHEIKIELLCHPATGPDVKMDERTISVEVEEVPPPPGVIDGQLLDSVVWYEGSWHGLRATNSWPADTELLFRNVVKNTGERVASFTVSFMGKSCSAYISPGNQGECSFKTTAVAGTHSFNVYGDSKLLESWAIAVTTYESLVATLRSKYPLPLLPRETI